MPREVKLIRVFLAAPGDVQKEREVAATILSEWNLLHGTMNGAFAELASWQTHSIPEQGDHPQEIINRQVLDDSDIVVGIFWTKFGTPTPEDGSGTEDEILRSIEQGKKVLIYFSDVAIPPSVLDSGQYSKVLRFKEENSDKGLYSSYSSIDEFETNFRAHITQSLNGLLSQSDPGDVERYTIWEPEFAVEMPAGFWVMALIGVDILVQRAIERGRRLGEQGVKPEDVSEEKKFWSVTGPILTRSAIVEALIAHGMMKPEAKSLTVEAMIKKAQDAESQD